MSFPFKKPQDVRAFFSHAAFQKAELLQLTGGVLDLEISENGHELAASVQGSQSWPYDVEIRLKPDRHGRFNVSGTCSCPMGRNCKHVAAVLLEAINPSPDEKRAVKAAAAKAKPLELPPHIVSWLNKIGTVSRGDTYPPEVRQRLIYGVRAHADDGHAPYPVALVWSVRLRKDDSFADVFSKVEN